MVARNLKALPVEFSAVYRVYYEDTDAAGVVYHANYLKFMERARMDWLISFGYLPQQPAKNWGVIFAVRSVTLDFIKPASLGDSLCVSIGDVEKRGASLKIQQQIFRDQQLLAEGLFRIACLDSKHMKARRIPTELSNRLNQ